MNDMMYANDVASSNHQRHFLSYSTSEKKINSQDNRIKRWYKLWLREEIINQEIMRNVYLPEGITLEIAHLAFSDSSLLIPFCSVPIRTAFTCPFHIIICPIRHARVANLISNFHPDIACRRDRGEPA